MQWFTAAPDTASTRNSQTLVQESRPAGIAYETAQLTMAQSGRDSSNTDSAVYLVDSCEMVTDRDPAASPSP